MKVPMKTIGVLLTIAGGLVTIGQGIVSEKQQEKLIEDKVNEALAKKEED